MLLFYNRNIEHGDRLSIEWTTSLASPRYLKWWREFVPFRLIATAAPSTSIFRCVYCLKQFDPWYLMFSLTLTLRNTRRSELGVVILLGMEKVKLRVRLGLRQGLRFNTIICILVGDIQLNVENSRLPGGQIISELHVDLIVLYNPV